MERPGGVPFCRYVTRQAIAGQRLSLVNNGNVIVELKSPYHDGTSDRQKTIQVQSAFSKVK
jgi:hypothetical protein